MVGVLSHNSFSGSVSAIFVVASCTIPINIMLYFRNAKHHFFLRILKKYMYVFVDGVILNVCSWQHSNDAPSTAVV